MTSAGADKWRNAIVAGLVKATGCVRVYERSDSDVRGLEGLEPTTGWLHGEPPTAGLSIDENGVQLAVDIVGGHKTGFYLDQRDNRAWLRSVAAGKEILNGFCYTGGFLHGAVHGGGPQAAALAA